MSWTSFPEPPLDPPEYDDAPNCCGSADCNPDGTLCYCSADFCDACCWCGDHCTCLMEE